MPRKALYAVSAFLPSLKYTMNRPKWKAGIPDGPGPGRWSAKAEKPEPGSHSLLKNEKIYRTAEPGRNKVKKAAGAAQKPAELCYNKKQICMAERICDKL